MGDAAVEAAATDVAVGEKRGADAAELTEGGPEPKVQETEAAEADDDVQDEAAGNDQEVVKEEAATEAAQSSEPTRTCKFPITLGPKTFESVDTALMYFRTLATTWPQGLQVNEFEHKVLSDLLRLCHPRPRSKIKDGVVAFKVKEKVALQSKCFHVVRADGKEDDFSYLKCLSTVAGYDLVAALKQKKGRADSRRDGKEHGGGRGGRGWGGGRGRGGGGGRRGGRGGGRGRK